jgi:hypothetical protein
MLWEEKKVYVSVCVLRVLPHLILFSHHHPTTPNKTKKKVTAAKDTVLERARRRGETTRRVVPDAVLLASLEQVRER